ncbi:MAG: DUF1772 domain-containing protein [Betaproteobacteria bacterium]|nr:DUF1772 domain-containing protein [Betaproteobacteria bacterium]
MLGTLQFLATFCAAIFAGAALYITLVEHPVRLGLDTAAAMAQWAPSYQRATLMQAPLAIASSLAGFGAWLLDGGIVWLAAAVFIGVVVPFTFLGVMPTNKKLLALASDRASPEARTLLERWGLLHAVRTASSIVATVLMLWGLLGA